MDEATGTFGPVGSTQRLTKRHRLVSQGMSFLELGIQTSFPAIGVQPRGPGPRDGFK